LLGLLVAILVPLVAWISPRLTKEGRLVEKLRRLGAVYAVLPAGPDRDTFASRLSYVVAELNAWTAPSARRRRNLQRLVSVAVWVLALIAVISTSPLVARGNFVSQIVTGLIIGGLATGLSQLAAFWIGRRDAQRDEQDAATARQAFESRRLESFRRGDPPDVRSPGESSTATS
jgi:hypothetical protein